MDTYEVAAIGDLYKKNVSGRKTWNLREFALTGVLLIYYKKGVKRGEWDISGCKVRKITPEEAQQPAAKFAFAIEGNKKQFMLSSNNEKNRELWINVLEKQIHEFRNPVRRFIRTGEIVHANGFVKKKSVFGKTPVLLVVTNFPRVIEIDPATIELIEQFSWVPSAPPSMAKLSDTKFKIMVSGKELRFEDPANGMAYWEALFKRLNRIELWTPSKQPTLRIGFPGGTRPKKKEEEGEKKPDAGDAGPAKPVETSKDLKFLEEALSHIQELLTTLNLKIEEIDMVFALAVQEGHEASEDQSALAQERQLKRSQLVMLKENIDVIADNLKSLILRSKQTGSALFDVTAIESVISEAATLLVLLNSDDDDENEPDAAPADVMTNDVKHIDELIAQAEEEVIIVEEQMNSGDVAEPEIIAAVTAAEASAEQNQNQNVRGSVYTRQSTMGTREPVTDLDINPNTFDPSDPLKRPDGWTDVLMKRVLKKEQADREVGLSEDIILSERLAKEQAEDALMCEEVAKHGNVLGLKVNRKGRAQSLLQQDVSSFDVSPQNFDFPHPTKRPNYWPELRSKRVMLKEHIDRIAGVSEGTIVEQRSNKEIDEELALVGEVLCYGRLLNVGESKTLVVAASVDISDFNEYSSRPAEWEAVKLRRVEYKDLEDRLNGADESEIVSKRDVRMEEEETDMVAEAKDGMITILGTRRKGRKGADIDIAAQVEYSTEATSSSDFNVPDTSSFIEEAVQYSDATITFGSMNIETAPEPEQSPPKPNGRSSMVGRGSINGRASVMARPQKAVMELSSANINDISNRPMGWADIKLRRVYLKEWEDRKNGLDEDEIMEKRYQRELEAEQEMIAELGVRGKIALFEKGVSKPAVVKAGKKAAQQEFAKIISESGLIFDRMKANFAKVEVK